jgi:hypothetical protein
MGRRTFVIYRADIMIAENFDGEIGRRRLTALEKCSKVDIVMDRASATTSIAKSTYAGPIDKIGNREPASICRRINSLLR